MEEEPETTQSDWELPIRDVPARDTVPQHHVGTQEIGASIK